MAKIINVIYRPHLTTYKAFDESEYRCCCACEYKVIVQKDDNSLLAASVMDDTTLRDFDVDECVRKLSKDGENEDWCYPFRGCVDILTLNNFISGDIEAGDKPTEAIRRVLSELSESGCHCSDDVKLLIDTLLPTLEKIKEKE